MARRSETSGGAAAFDAYYGRQFGERWPALKAALLEPTRPIAFRADPELSGEPYYLDAASLIAAASLPLAGAERLLDLCAAPGGKTLVLASRMPDEAALTANERSAERRERLRRVVDAQLGEKRRSRIRISGRDGAQWSRWERDAYDRILLDAPCSSERHVLNSPPHLAAWTPARVRHLAQGEWALLSGAFLVLAVGGELLYATCALSEAENDAVIDRLVAKFAANLSVLPPDLNSVAWPPLAVTEGGRVDVAIQAAEPTRWGCRILPDRADGAGPLYFCRVKRLV